MFASPEEARKSQAIHEGWDIEPSAPNELANDLIGHSMMGRMNVSAYGSPSTPPYSFGYETGERFFGGLGAIDFNTIDYWTLRQRSDNAYRQSIYGLSIIRRLVTSIIVDGLKPEASPYEAILGDVLGKTSEEWSENWCEDVETRFTLWANDPCSCDATEQQTFGALQELAFREALVGGDCLVTLQIWGNSPKIRIFPGRAVQSPGKVSTQKGNRIEHGVELDPQGRHVAYWVRQQDNTFKRLPAWGEKSGRRLAFLLYGNDRRVDEVRGMPLLAIILQSLHDLDKYRASMQRKALVASMVALWVERTQDKLPGSSLANMATGAQRVGATTAAAPTTEPRNFNIAEMIPGAIVEDLGIGETMHAFSSNGVTDSYADFEMACIRSMAYVMEIPPEILVLSFDKSFAASKAANNEFAVFVSKKRQGFANTFNGPIYQEWLLNEVLLNRVKAPGLIEAYRSNNSLILNAWTAVDFVGAIKPHVDPNKDLAAIETQLRLGLITYARACRQINGMKWSRVIKTLARERAQMIALGIPVDMPMTDLTQHMLPNDDPEPMPAPLRKIK